MFSYYLLTDYSSELCFVTQPPSIFLETIYAESSDGPKTSLEF